MSYFVDAKVSHTNDCRGHLGNTWQHCSN